MRTTLVIADPVYERACDTAKRDHKHLSELVTEAVENYLLDTDKKRRKSIGPYRLKSFAMGCPAVDINNRDETFRTMEG